MYSFFANNLRYSRSPLLLTQRLIRGRARIKDNQHVTASNSLIETKHDFFGIETGDGLIAVNQDGVDLVPATEKYRYLIGEKKWSDETVHQTNWGEIRLDSLNKPEFHGQYDVDAELEFNDYKPIFIDDNIISDLCQKISSNNTSSSHNTKSILEENIEKITHKDTTPNIPSDIKSKRFQGTPENINQKESVKYSPEKFETSSLKIFHTSKEKVEIKSENSIEPIRKPQNIEQRKQQPTKIDKIPMQSKENIKPKITKDEHSTLNNKQNFKLGKEEVSLAKDAIKLSPTEAFPESKIKTKQTIKLDEKQEFFKTKKVNGKAPISAYEYMLRMKEEEKMDKKTAAGQEFALNVVRPDQLLDSKGFLLLKNQVPNLVRVPREILLHSLKANIIYDNFDIVALDKPYGMLCDSRNTNKYLPDIYDLADDLAKLITPRTESPKLFPLHRLDRGTSGVFLFARSKARYDQIKEMFKENKVKKKYWLITRGIPSPDQGIIDIPIVEGTIGNKYRMVLHPKGEDIRRFVHSSPDASRAVTTFQVLTSANGAALVEASPETGVKHQLRVHFGFGLQCPILGDHKYSYLNRLVPQRLPGTMLNALGVRQSKVRSIPIHLHAKVIVLPELEAGRNIFIQAPLPYHFRKNMKALKLVPPKKK